ncbi:MAG: type II toxin-antitoxin system VapC family toxin [Proteobacteria bacterium]|nr:type II toxin-antitoxin system VapC family toxin [Pseudomonadota bacterium]
MILVDANLLVYAHVSDFAEHAAARAWLDGQLSGSTRVGLAWPSLLAFVRLVSNARVFERPEPISAAWRQVREWLSAQTAWVPSPTASHAEVLEPLMLGSVSRPNLVPDAHLAALAIEHGLTLCSTDGDFARFPGLVWTNPLARVD